MIHRHNKSAIFMHWFNALCWIPLLATGFAILSNPGMHPAGSWWSDFCISLFGENGLLAFHLGLGLLWVTVYAVCIVLNGRSDVIPFLREILQVHPVSDIVWCMRKGFWLVLGEKGMKRFGLNSELPPQGFYNAGQKWVAIAAVLFSVGLVTTGVALGLGLVGWFPNLGSWTAPVLQIALLFHLVCAGVMSILLAVHIYMAALAPGEGPALRSMFTGYVPEEFVKHHNPLWHEELKRKA